MPSSRSANSTTAAANLRSDAADALALDAGWHARLAARQVTARLDAALRPSGLSSTQFALLCLIAAAPDDTVGALAERAGLNPSTMSRNVDQLSRAGWVEVALVEHDRRRRAVWLTERGARQLKAAMPQWRNAQQALQQQLGPALARQFSRASAALGPVQEKEPR